MATNKTKRANKNIWFYKVRGSYLPANKYGWLSYIPFIVYLVFSFIVGIKDISMAWVAALFILANWIAAGSLITALAIRKVR